MSDDAKKTILARRAKFIAAAVASVGVACRAEPCLSVMPPSDAAQGSTPQADAAPDPVACLAYVAPNPQPDDAGPMPCLKVREPRKDGGK